jgi:uncharacterized protein
MEVEVTLLLPFVLAVGAGGLGALLGIGGGLIIVPVLTGIVGVEIKVAIATSLIAVIATSTAAAAPYLDRGIADRRIGLPLLVATAAGGVAGGTVAGFLDARLLALLFGLVLVIVSARTLREGRGGDGNGSGVDPEAPGAFNSSYFDPRSKAFVPFTVHRIPLGMGISVVAGSISGLLGIGGGIINVPTIHLVMGAPLRVATSTSTYMLGATAVASGLIYYSRGQIDPLVAAPVALGVFLGARGGARVAHRVPQQALRLAFAGLALVFAAQMFLKAAGL